MKIPLIRQGEGPARALARQLEQREADQRQVDRIVREAEANAPDLDSRRTSRATPAGDERKLRGIPALARGVGGAMPGSRPGSNLD